MTYGEWDHASIAPTDMDALSVSSGMTAQTNMTSMTNTKFQQVGHMKMPQPSYQPSRAPSWGKQPGYGGHSERSGASSLTHESGQNAVNGMRELVAGDKVVYQGKEWAVMVVMKKQVFLQRGAGRSKALPRDEVNQLQRL